MADASGGSSESEVKLWFQKHTVQGRLAGLDRAYEAHLRRVARPGTRIHFHTLPPETYRAQLPESYVRYGCVESLFASYFALQALRAERAGYDAYIIGTSQDPGLAEARGWAEIPVLGYGETTASIAAMLSQRFSFVGFIPELAEPIVANMRRYGLADRLGPFAFVASGPGSVEAAFGGTRGPFVEAFQEAARTAIQGGAELLIPADGLTNEILVEAGIQAVDDAPILDANGLLIKMAELFADSRRLHLVAKPHRGYYNRRPSREHITHLLSILAPRAFPVEDV